MRIKHIMKERGVTSKELASKIGLTEMGISKILTEKSTPNGKTIMKIAEVLGVTCGELFDDYKEAELVCPHCGRPIHIRLE